MKTRYGITIKKEKDLLYMREAGRFVSSVLDCIGAMVSPGISTMSLEEKARKLCEEAKIKPAFLGYSGFPAALCISINEEIVHGIPSEKRFLQEGDIVSVDMGAIYEGYYGDSARTFAVGKVDKEKIDLMNATKLALEKGIENMRDGSTLYALSRAIQAEAEKNGYGIVRQYTGHGIGKVLHEKPYVFNYAPNTGGDIPLEEGMVLAIEPMFVLGSEETKTLEDGWTVVTKDSSCAAHFEHTVAITKDGPEILTSS
ncbi:MAG: type I methionyl aminopeptidase [Desulfovibrionaceae bacterium]